MALHVADEIDVNVPAQAEGLERELVALAFLGADAEDAHAGILVTEHFAGVDAAHDGVVNQVNRFTFDVGAGIEQDEFLVRRRDDGGNAAAVHARNPAELEGRRGENATGVAEGNDAVGLAFVNQFHGAGDGAIAFAAQGGGRLVLHGKHFTGMNEVDPPVAQAGLFERGLNVVLVADEVDGGEMVVGFESAFNAFNDDLATVVAAHDIHCDAHS